MEMRKQPLLLFFMLFASVVMFIGCSNETSIVGKPNDSKIILDEKRKFVTIHAVLHNNGGKPASPYYAKFEIKKGKLQVVLGEKTIVLTDNEQPFPIPIGSNMDFFVGETFEYEGVLTVDDVKDAVDVIIFSDSEEEITRFTITKVEKESIAK